MELYYKSNFESLMNFKHTRSMSPQMCAPGPTGPAATGSATSKIQAIRRGAFTRRRTDILKICLIFVMEMRRLGAMKIAQVEKKTSIVKAVYIRCLFRTI